MCSVSIGSQTDAVWPQELFFIRSNLPVAVGWLIISHELTPLSLRLMRALWLASCFYHLRVFRGVIKISADKLTASRLHTAVLLHKFNSESAAQKMSLGSFRECLRWYRSKTHRNTTATATATWLAKLFLWLLTLKNSFVEPESRVPYAISVCLARSSALSMGETILSTVRKAARLAV